MTRKRQAIAAAFGVLLGLTVSGCPFMPDKGDGDDHDVVTFHPRTSPQNLLENLKASYKQRQLDEYDSLLSRDFEFVFCPYDQSQPDIPDSWGRVDEIDAQDGMFDSEYVQDLTMDFEYSTPIFDEEHFDGVDSLWVVEVTQMRLSLTGTPPSAPPGTPAETYRVNDGQVTMWFRKDPGNVVGGRQIWKIVEMQETTVIEP
jgi:hypothetical protein